MKQSKIKKYIKAGFCWLMLLGILTGNILHADNTVDDKKTGIITLDWNEFSSILKLDKDEVRLSWDEFTKLLLQTGFNVKPEYRVEGGDVILTRAQFNALLNKMVAPKKNALIPPGEYLIKEARYKAIVGGESTEFDAVLDIEIFKNDRKTYSKIPLFREELAIEDILFDQKPASIITESGWHYLNTDEYGKHSVKVKFSVKSSLDKGVLGLNFNIPQTPITHLILDIPKTDIDVNIANAQGLKIDETNRHTRVEGYLVPTTYMNISWRKKIEEIVRGPAKVYAELLNLLSIEGNAIRVTTKVKLNIVQNKINSITLAVPSGWQVLDVSGQGKSMWNIRQEKSKELLDIPFEYPIEGDREITINSEKLLSEETVVSTFTGFEVMGSDRESGFIAGEVKSDAEADVQEFEGLTRIDFQNIPPEITGLSSRPILFAFKYIRHPYNIVVDIKKYEKEEALSAVIDFAQGTTFFKEEGKLAHKVVFSMRNLWSQFLKLDLPKDSSIWSVYVDGKREKASKDEDGKILIPLARSQRVDNQNNLKPFNIELIYVEPVKKFTIFGKKKHNIPSTDILINKLAWNIYLPENYKYLHFGGNLKKEKIPKIRKPILSRICGALSNKVSLSSFDGRAQRASAVRPRKGEKYKEYNDYKETEIKCEEPLMDYAQGYDKNVLVAPMESKAENAEMDGDYYHVDQITGEDRGDVSDVAGITLAKPSVVLKSKKDVSLGLAGLLSVRVNIPFSGKNYLFSKKIIEKDESLHLNFNYVDERVIDAILIIFVLFLGYVLFKIRNIFIIPLNALFRGIVKLADLSKQGLKPKVLPGVVLLLLIISKFLRLYLNHPLLTLALIALFVFSLARLFKKQLIVLAKFIWRPLVSLSVFSLLAAFFIITRLFRYFPPLFLLIVLGFIISSIRAGISILKEIKEKKKLKEINKEVNEENNFKPKNE